MILTEQEIAKISQSCQGADWAYQLVRKTEAAVLEKLNAQSVKSPDNGKWNTGIASDGQVFLQSDDFNHDVRLYVNGDFDGDTADYADRLAAWMNSHPLPPADVVRVAELEAVLRECREALVKNIVGTGGRTPAAHEAIAKIDEVLNGPASI